MKTVLFVCNHNAGRSQMAEAFFNNMAQYGAKAISAGSNPARTVNPVVVAAMREVGIDISHNKPKLLTMEMMDGVQKAITMGCEATCPLTTVETENWQLADPQEKPLEQVRKIRDEIKLKMVQLVKEIEQGT